MNERVGRLLSALERTGLSGDLSPEEVVDALWLACRMSGKAATSGFVLGPGETTPEQPGTDPPPIQPGGPGNLPAPLLSAGVKKPAPTDGTDSGAARLDVRVGAAPALEGRAAITAALKKSLPRVASDDAERIDEDATTERIAQEKLVEPVPLRIGRRHLEVALLVDEGVSMLPWRGVAEDLERVLRQSGAFRDVRPWSLCADGQTTLRAGLARRVHDGLRAPPRTILDPTGRRLVLVFSDCTGRGWHDGSMVAALAEWARSGPVALVQALPKSMWSRTALARGAEVRLKPGAAFAANAGFAWEPYPPPSRRQRRHAAPAAARFPVVALEERAMARFAHLLGGIGRDAVPGVMWTPESFQPGATQEEAPPRTAAQRIQRFHEMVSPTARQLGALLAAAAPLTLSTIRLIRRAMLPEAGAVHESEVLLGGILRIVSDGDSASGEVAFDFAGDDERARGDVRALLLNEVSTYDAIEVLKRVATHDAEGGETLRVVFGDWGNATGKLRRSGGPLEKVAAQVFLRIGGEYARRVEAPAVEVPAANGRKVALSHEEMLRLHAAIVSAGLTGLREALLSGIAREFVVGLPQTTNASEQVLIDLDAMNSVGTLIDGSVPIAIWLANATTLAGQRKEAAVFAQALARLRGGPAPERAPTADPPKEPRRQPARTSPEPIRILFLGANPDDTTRFGLDREVREITQRLRASGGSDQLEVIQEWAVRVDDLQAALVRHRPQIVHFSGYGQRSAAGLRVEDVSGKHVPIGAEPLARLFQLVGHDIRCVVLNACYSAEQAKAISQHIDCVVGMTDAIQDRAAIAFAGSFYQALAFGQSVQTAFELGSNEIDLAGLGQADVPMLLARAGVSPPEVYIASSRIGVHLPPSPTEPARAIPTPPTEPQPVDLGIVVALEEELRALLDLAVDYTPYRDADLIAYLFARGSYRCAVTLVGKMGEAQAAGVTERLLALFDPTSIVGLGVAAAMGGDLRIGDVHVPSQVIQYRQDDRASAAEGGGFALAPDALAYRADFELFNAVRDFKLRHQEAYQRWRADCHADLEALLPDVEARERLFGNDLVRRELTLLADGHIATGPLVVATPAFLAWIRTHDRNVKAFEMESAAVLLTAQNRSIPKRAFAIRGISDYGDSRKQVLDGIDGAPLRAYAMRNAVRLLWALLDTESLPAASTTRLVPA